MTQLQTPSRDLRLTFFALLGLWIGIELLYSSHWLEASSWQRQPRKESKANNRLVNLLTPPGGQRPERVWFAPYTTFPETGMIESQLRRGVYDTFLAFPREGITSNYGAYKLSPADSLFAQASSQGLLQEAQLAQTLGYRQFAIDLGAVTTPQPLQALCQHSQGCRLSSDGYALFPLGAPEAGWIAALQGFQRRQPNLPQVTAAPRWGGLVFHPDQWWRPERLTNPAEPGLRIWARPGWAVQLYRYDAAALPAQVRNELGPHRNRVWLRLAPGLKGATICLQRERAWWRGGDSPCRRLKLQDVSPRVDIGPLLPAGQVSTLQLEWILGPEGLPYPLRLLPAVGGNPSQQAAFAVEITSSPATDGSTKTQGSTSAQPQN